MSANGEGEIDIEQVLQALASGDADQRIGVLRSALGDVTKLVGAIHDNTPERLAYGAFGMSLWAALVAESEAVLNAAARDESMQFIRDYEGWRGP
jgi:hypothetical protein